MPNKPSALKLVSPRKAPSQERSKRKVGEILSAARELLISDGLNQLTTNHIARQAGMSVGSLYQYFPNKQAILYQLYKDWLESFLQELSNFKMPEDIKDPIDRFEAMLDHFYLKWTSEKDRQILEGELFKAMQLYPDLRELEQSHQSTFVQEFSTYMQHIGIRTSKEELEFISTYIIKLNDVISSLFYLDKYPEEKILNLFKQQTLSLLRETIDSPG